ncbi:Transcriptional regulator, LysR family [Labilithrix luteola]|uniref:Transcriptional regulator, LysR family n=1 Tax=Labilithrix luteola TaxID=1391654 RepID=A0A0K1PNX1_9BACT|nr:LysR family transcriptional regulator [Labilithrix luteola]AKU95116.1 Transcriptional regulator, LysR family [Labilithrix luteola]
MDRLDTMRLFVRVVETSSFSKAARAEGVAQSTASKQVAALEKRLGTQLLRRTTRGLSMTEAGRTFYDDAVRLLADLDAAEARAGHGHGAPGGQLRVAAPSALSRMYVVPHLPVLLARYPALRVELDVSDRYVNLVEEGVDVAIRIGSLRDSSLVARRMGTFDIVTVASPDYVARHGEPHKPSELERHACVAFMFRGAPRPWEFRTTKGPIPFTPSGPTRFDDAESIRAAVLAGLGIAHVPGWLFAEELTTGNVVSLLKTFAPERVPLQAVYPSDRRTSSKAKVFIEFLAETFAECSWLKAR